MQRLLALWFIILLSRTPKDPNMGKIQLLNSGIKDTAVYQRFYAGQAREHFRGASIGIDASMQLHNVIKAPHCAEEYFDGDTSSVLRLLRSRMVKLQTANIDQMWVFDGLDQPAKAATLHSRSASKR